MGKSSLLNTLLGYDRAIVSNIAGTTRDTVEESIQMAGLALRLIDTAGMRESSDVIEQAGITRTNRALETADLVLEVADASMPRVKDHTAPALTAPRLLILNKCDLGVHPDWKAVPGIRFSCATGEGRKELEEAIIQAFSSSLPGETGSSLVAINARHQHELGLCREHVRLASESISRQESPEFTALELREALTHLGEITGAVDTEDVLGAIFPPSAWGNKKKLSSTGFSDSRFFFPLHSVEGWQSSKNLFADIFIDSGLLIRYRYHVLCCAPFLSFPFRSGSCSSRHLFCP